MQNSNIIYPNDVVENRTKSRISSRDPVKSNASVYHLNPTSNIIYPNENITKTRLSSHPKSNASFYHVNQTSNIIPLNANTAKPSHDPIKSNASFYHLNQNSNIIHPNPSIAVNSNVIHASNQVISHQVPIKTILTFDNENRTKSRATINDTIKSSASVYHVNQNSNIIYPNENRTKSRTTSHDTIRNNASFYHVNQNSNVVYPNEVIENRTKSRLSSHPKLNASFYHLNQSSNIIYPNPNITVNSNVIHASNQVISHPIKTIPTQGGFYPLNSSVASGNLVHTTRSKSRSNHDQIKPVNSVYLVNQNGGNIIYPNILYSSNKNPQVNNSSRNVSQPNTNSSVIYPRVETRNSNRLNSSFFKTNTPHVTNSGSTNSSLYVGNASVYASEQARLNMHLKPHVMSQKTPIITEIIENKTDKPFEANNGFFQNIATAHAPSSTQLKEKSSAYFDRNVYGSLTNQSLNPYNVNYYTNQEADHALFNTSEAFYKNLTIDTQDRYLSNELINPNSIYFKNENKAQYDLNLWARKNSEPATVFQKNNNFFNNLLSQVEAKERADRYIFNDCNVFFQFRDLKKSMEQHNLRNFSVYATQASGTPQVPFNSNLVMPRYI